MTSCETSRCEAVDNEGIQAALGAVLSGDYTSAEFKAANRHLAGCAACRKEYGELSAFRKRVRGNYGLEEGRSSEAPRPGPLRRWTWGGLALAASLLVGVAVWQVAPGSMEFFAPPEPSFASGGGDETARAVGAVTEAISGENLVMAAGTPAGTGNEDGLEMDLDEISDAELDEILYELGY